jgi:glycosyltransferase involved in cell wall biosynthesis
LVTIEWQRLTNNDDIINRNAFNRLKPINAKEQLQAVLKPCQSTKADSQKPMNSDRGLLANIDGTYRTQTGSDKSIVNIKDFAQKMKLLYQNKELREEYSKNCLEFVKDYHWDKIIPMWLDLLIQFKEK